MIGADGAGLWRVPRRLALATVLLVPSAGLAIEPNPFLPPNERADEIEGRLQKRIDRAVAVVEERLTKTIVDAMNGHDIVNAPKHTQDTVARRSAPASSPPSAANTSLPPGLPGLPPLPSFLGGITGQGGTAPGGASSMAPGTALGGPAMANASAASDPVPSGAIFIGCLDGKAFFQDRAGSPFLVDPRAFPPSSGGAGACGR